MQRGLKVVSPSLYIIHAVGIKLLKLKEKSHFLDAVNDQSSHVDQIEHDSTTCGEFG